MSIGFTTTMKNCVSESGKKAINNNDNEFFIFCHQQMCNVDKLSKTTKTTTGNASLEVTKDMD